MTHNANKAMKSYRTIGSCGNRKNEIQKEIKGIERGMSKMVDYAPGMRTIIRDEEWIVKK